MNKFKVLLLLLLALMCAPALAKKKSKDSSDSADSADSSDSSDSSGGNCEAVFENGDEWNDIVTAPDSPWGWCADEAAGGCDCTGLVIYGADGVFTFPMESTGLTACDNAVYGDPLDCCGKSCYCLPGASLSDVDTDGYYWAYPAGGEPCQAGDGNCYNPETFSCEGQLVVGTAQTDVWLGPVDVDVGNVACLAEDIDALGVFGTADCPDPFTSDAFPVVKPSCMCLAGSTSRRHLRGT